MADDIKKDGWDLTDVVRKAMEHKNAKPDPRINGNGVTPLRQPPPDTDKLLLHQLDLPWPGPDDRLVQQDMIPSTVVAIYALISPSPIHGGKPRVTMRIALLGDPDQPPRAHQFMLLHAGQVIASTRGGPRPRHLQTLGNPQTGAAISVFEMPGMIVNAPALDPGNDDEHDLDDDADDDDGTEQQH